MTSVSRFRDWPEGSECSAVSRTRPRSLHNYMSLSETITAKHRAGIRPKLRKCAELLKTGLLTIGSTN